MSCVRWNVNKNPPTGQQQNNGWDDNFLCTEGYKRPVHGSWGSWGKWGECKTQCGKAKKFRERFCDSPRPRNEGRSCSGPHLDEKDCFKDHCRKYVWQCTIKGEYLGQKSNLFSTLFFSEYYFNMKMKKNCAYKISTISFFGNKIGVY